MKYRPTIPAVTLCLLLQAACSNQAVYTGESFAEDSPYKQRFDGDAVLACESARRSLLGQGYLIESASSEGVKGRKASKSGDAQNAFIEVNVVCLPDNRGSTLFASAQVSEYALKKSSSAASVGVSALGSISLPIGQSADSLVKVKEETIDDRAFYQGFFTAVGKTMAEMQAGKAPSVPEAQTAVPEPPPAHAPEPPPPAPTPAPAVVVEEEPAPPVAPAASPEVVPEPNPVTKGAATTELEPLPELPKPATLAEPLPQPAAPAESTPAQELPADSVSPTVLSPIIPVTAAKLQPTPEASKVSQKPTKAVPEPESGSDSDSDSDPGSRSGSETVPETSPEPLIKDLF